MTEHRTQILVPPIMWHGGKHYLANWIIEKMPPHLHYVEPYFGGGAVILARDPDKDWLTTQGLVRRSGSRELDHAR